MVVTQLCLDPCQRALAFAEMFDYTHHKASGSERKSTVFLRGRTQLNWLFLNLSPRFRCMKSLTSLVISIYLGFYCDISEWHVRSACAFTSALMLHLNNPCAKRKVLSLTKPKGKIYITKSLGHYITDVRGTCVVMFTVVRKWKLWPEFKSWSRLFTLS